MAGIIRLKAPSGVKGKPPASLPKEGDVLTPKSGSRLSISDVIDIAQEATAFMREAAGYLSEREKTRQALIQSQHELERINADLEKERMTHEEKMRDQDHIDKCADIIIQRISFFQVLMQEYVSNIPILNSHEFQSLLSLIDRSDVAIVRLLETIRR